MNLCRQMIDAAVLSGVDAVKFQSWSAGSLISLTEYSRNTQYADKKKHFGSLLEMVERYQFTPQQHKEILHYCKEKGMTFLSSCFSKEEVDLLESLAIPAFKIASMDINHIPLLEYIGGKGKPVILSTGMATLGEIERAVNTLKKNGSGPIALLHCVSIYPPAYNTIHLKNIPMLQMAFDLPVGFSDHTLGTAIPLAAIAIGACIIEKHFTLDKEMDGWDHAISANPNEMEIIVREGCNVFTSIGSAVRTVTDEEEEKRKKFRRRIVIRQPMKEGEVISFGDIDYKRPGTGIHPDEFRYVIGRQVNRDFEADEWLEWSDLK
ncbi:N-acetylneuraminate synthase family protein [Methanospirillum lacunae]|nr:N-acetylneuraminate synthase family protein [Methanospirillum lacunae]